MEKYINNESIIKDKIYLAFKDSVICPLCKNILIEPFMCKGCQSDFCKKCIDEKLKNDKKCPINKCENPDYQKDINRKNTLAKLKFECEKCGMEIKYEKIKEHVDNCNSTRKRKKSSSSTDKGDREKIKRLTMAQVKEIKKKEESLYAIKSKIDYY